LSGRFTGYDKGKLSADVSKVREGFFSPGKQHTAVFIFPRPILN
jgi:hypothetical protein